MHHKTICIILSLLFVVLAASGCFKPNPKTQDEYNKLVAERQDKIRNIEREIERLRIERQSLIDNALTGDIDQTMERALDINSEIDELKWDLEREKSDLADIVSIGPPKEETPSASSSSSGGSSSSPSGGLLDEEDDDRGGGGGGC